MIITLKAMGFILIVCAFYIGGTLFEDLNKQNLKELADVINSVECMQNSIRCDKTTIYEALGAISTHQNVMGDIARRALDEYETQKNVPLNQVLAKSVSGYRKNSFIMPSVCSVAEYMFERLGKNDFEYQINILSEASDMLKKEYARLDGDYSKTKGLYSKASLCIGIIVAVLFI